MPIPIPEYDSLDGLALAQLVRERSVSPLELVEAAIARIEARNPKLNAVIVELYDRARDQAKAPLSDGPFRGVPFLLKDLGAMLAGVPLGHPHRIAPLPISKSQVDCQWCRVRDTNTIHLRRK